MPAHSELTFEVEIERYLLGHGWAEGIAAEYDRALGLTTGPLFEFVGATQPEEWQRLVATYGDANLAQRKFAERAAAEITHRGTVDVLRRGVKDGGIQIRLCYFEPASDLTPELRDLYDRNVLTVSRQVHHSESNPHASIDVLLSVNGLPVATAELKNGIGQNVRVAIGQYRKDRNAKDLIFHARTLVHFAVDANQVYMATDITQPFLPFNQGSSGPGRDGGQGNPASKTGHATAYLWEQIWQRNNWLDLLGSFVHAEAVRDDDGKTTGKTRLLFPRYHQWDAVTKLLVDARSVGPGQNRLIQHSAGSGKSNTIAWLAHQLSRLHTPSTQAEMGEGAATAGLYPNMPVFDKVVVITDRVVLDRQLQDTIASFDHAPGMVQKIDEDSQQLREALEGKKARIIITTLQKFPVISATIEALQGVRFAVVVDEAHTSQSGEAVKHLKRTLTNQATLKEIASAEAAAEDAEPDVQDLLAESAAARGRQGNLSFFAFTATPKQKTLALFGQIRPGEETHSPFHLYSMRQAIEEGFILDVLASYTTYKTYYRLANNLTAEDPEVPAGKAGSILARWASLHPSMIEQRVEILVEHFRAHTSRKIGGRAKAMVVTESRLHAVRYHQAIQKYCREKAYDIGPGAVRALVAFSGTVTDPDLSTTAYTEPTMNGFSESQLPKKFAGPEYGVLVVAEKYQTGFDQPLLHTMYVIKRLKDIKAVQTLSRLNRVTAGKDDTFVLDFVNDGADIQEAFAPYFTETTAVPSNPNDLYTLHHRIMNARIVDPVDLRTVAVAVLTELRGANAAVNAGLRPAYDRWAALADDDPDKELFRTAVRDFVRGYAFMGQIMANPDPELEELYLYCKLLAPMLSRVGDPILNLDGAVSLSHLRTELRGDAEDLSLAPGPADPLAGALGGGLGKQHEQPLSPLSQLIETLNERFGTHLTDHDKILETIQSRLEADDNIRDIAANNDRANFEASLSKPLMTAALDTQGVQSEFVDKLFASGDMQKAVVRELAKLIWNNINNPNVA